MQDKSRGQQTAASNTEHLGKILKESAIGSLGSYIGLVLNYILVFVITRFLSPADFGIFTLGQTIINLSLVLVLFGTPKALDRFIPQYQVLKEWGKVRTLINRVLRWVSLTSAIIVTLLFFLAPLFANWFSESRLTYVLRSMLLALPAIAIVREMSSVFLGFKESRYRVFFELWLIPFLKLLLGSLVLGAGLGLTGWVWVFSFASLAGAVAALWAFYQKVWKLVQPHFPQDVSFRKVLSYAWPLSFSSVILLMTGQMEPLFLGYFWNASEVGIFRVYVYVVSLISVIMTSFAQIFKPVASGFAARNDLQGLTDIYRRVAKWLFQLNLAILLIFLMLGEDLLRFLFPAEYLVELGALLVLLGGWFLNSACGPEGRVLEALGNTRLSLFNSIIMLVTNFVVDLVLIPRHGILGAAIGASSAIAIGGLAGVVELFVLYRMQPFGWMHLRFLIIGLISAAIAYASKIVAGDGLLGLILQALVFSILYTIGLLWGRGFDEIDRDLWTRIWLQFGNLKQAVVNRGG